MVALGVVDLEVEVAVLVLFGEGDAGADVCLIFIEYDSDCLEVLGVTDCGSSRLATATAVLHICDGNILAVWLIIGSGCCDAEGGEEAENESRDGVLHSEGFKKKV